MNDTRLRSPTEYAHMSGGVSGEFLYTHTAAGAPWKCENECSSFNLDPMTVGDGYDESAM